jgi:hypothetical protein
MKKYDNIIKAIQISRKPIKRGAYIYNIEPRVTDGGDWLANSLYRVDAWEAAHGYSVPHKFLRDI